MSGERFYVVALTGFGKVGASSPRLTASVLDRAYCHREVARFAAPRAGSAPGFRGGVSRAVLDAAARAHAEAEAARLNAWAATA